MTEPTSINPIPRSDWAVLGSAQVLDGIAGYAFLIAAGRMLGPAGFAPVSVMWTAQFLVGSGLFLAYELELARATAECIAHSESTERRYRATGQIFAIQLLVVIGVLLILFPTLTDRLFDNQPVVTVALAIGVIGFAATHLVRGPLAGIGFLRLFALWFVADAAAQTVALVSLAAAGVRSPGPFALAAGGASIFAVAAVSLVVYFRGSLRFTKVAAVGSQPVPRGPIARSLASLTGATLLTAIVTNSGPLAITWLDRTESTTPAVFIAGLILTRPPLLLFQTLQATLIPQFTALAVASDHQGFSRRIASLVIGVVGTGCVACGGAAALGPWLLRALFGSDYRLSALDLGLQTAATFTAILALALGVGLIGLSRQDLVAACWAIGVLALAASLAVPAELTIRVARALVLGGAAASAAMALAIVSELRSPRWGLRPPDGPMEVPTR